MHDIEPYYHWRDKYIAAEDERSPFFGRIYDEFAFTRKIYNYFIHPQWDEFGSATLYLKVLYTDYEKCYAIIELMGEWNDALHNDVMFLKRDVVDDLLAEGIMHYILICENVLNFHGDDDSYYEEWYEDVSERGGWVCMLNTLPHVLDELRDTHLQGFVHFGEVYNDVNWRPQKPDLLFEALDALASGEHVRLLF